MSDANPLELVIPRRVLALRHAAGRRDEYRRFRLDVVRFGRDLRSSYAVATDMKVLAFARWGWGRSLPPVPEVSVPLAVLRAVRRFELREEPVLACCDCEHPSYAWRLPVRGESKVVIGCDADADAKRYPNWRAFDATAWDAADYLTGDDRFLSGGLLGRAVRSIREAFGGDAAVTAHWVRMPEYEGKQLGDGSPLALFRARPPDRSPDRSPESDLLLVAMQMPLTPHPEHVRPWPLAAPAAEGGAA